MGERPATPSPARPRRTPWALLIQWVWKVEPDRCPCGAMMRRSRAILERHELVRLLTALHLAGYPRRPPAAPGFFATGRLLGEGDAREAVSLRLVEAHHVGPGRRPKATVGGGSRADPFH